MEKSVHFRINSPKVIHETIDGETVIVNLDSGNYYSLDAIGADIWDAIGKSISVDQIIEDISSRYTGEQTEIESAIHNFVDELLHEALISPLEGACPEPGDGHKFPANKEGSGKQPLFTVPALQKYSDMQELLLLDPIHEVDDTGWPNVKAENA